jgi:hypothetical protein
MDLWDRVKQELTDGVNTASVRSKEAIDALKINNQISTLEGQKSKAFEDLGRIVYAQRLNAGNDEAGIQAKCVTITSLDAQIRQKQEELARVHSEAEAALRKAPAAEHAHCECGQELAPGAKFCTACGRKQEPHLLDSAPPSA